MAKHLQKFTDPFRDSTIPFFLAEVLTDGAGRMVDLTLRFANDRLCALLDVSPETLKGKRFTRLFPAGQLEQLTPLQTVAFSGSSAAFTYTTMMGSALHMVCWQPMYGLAACILNAPAARPLPETAELPADQLPAVAAVLELSREGVRLLSFSSRLCPLTGREYRELLDVYADDFPALVAPEDRTALVQALLDSSRGGAPLDHAFRLLHRDGSLRWMALRAEVLSRERGSTTFSALLLDVDAQLREQERKRAHLHQAESALSQFSQLFHGLPGGYCLLREVDGGLSPIRVSQGLAGLLGEPLAEVVRHLGDDPLWRIPPQDRDALLKAAQAAREANVPLRCTCRIQVHGGALRWGLIEASRQVQMDGAALVFVSCSDVTTEKEAVSELEFRSRLCELLLSDPRLISFDYDPVADVARIFRRDKEGRRVSRMIPEYIRDLEHSAIIHPEDQKRLATAVKKAANHPETEHVEYRADYDGQGYRWYQVAWVSLFDSKGDIYRLVGKAEDISRRKAAAQRFRELKALQKSPAPGTLAAVQLDLSGDRILDVRTNSRALTALLFGNTAADCLDHLAAQIPTETQQAEFRSLFSRKALLDAYHDGHLVRSLAHRFLPGPTAALWARTTLHLIEDPDTGHAAAFCTVQDEDALHNREAMLELLARRDYDLVVTVHPVTGLCRSYGRPLPEGLTYQDLRARLEPLLHRSLPTLEELSQSPEQTLDCHPGTLTVSPLDPADQTLLLTLRDTGSLQDF